MILGRGRCVCLRGGSGGRTSEGPASAVNRKPPTGTCQYLEYLFYAYLLCILFVFARTAHSLGTAQARTERLREASSGILTEAPASVRFQFGDGRLQAPVHRSASAPSSLAAEAGVRLVTAATFIHEPR